MYNFKNLEISTSNKNIPSYAMLIDGKTIEELIPEFTTLSVYGRENIDVNVDFYNIPGLIGSRIKEKNIKHRIITINYSIVAKTNEEFRKAYNKLNYLLYKEFKDKRYINFKDEEKYFYNVQIFKVEPISANTNTVEGSFSLISETPYKFSEVKEAEKIENLEYPLYPIFIESIETKAAQGQLFKLSNISTGKNIILLNDFQGGEVIEIMSDNIKINKLSSLNKLDFVKSDYKEFEIYSEDEITVNSNEKIKIRYREVLL